VNRATKRNLGICYDCQSSADPGKTRCAIHVATSARASAKYNRSAKGKAYKASAFERRHEIDRAAKRAHRHGHGRFDYVRKGSSERGKAFTITKAEWQTEIAKPCHYCGMENDSSCGVGLDRLDNTLGYVSGNVVSCCIDCNIARGNRFTPDEMRSIGRTIYIVKLRRFVAGLPVLVQQDPAIREIIEWLQLQAA
jgi:hypothetical protein